MPKCSQNKYPTIAKIDSTRRASTENLTSPGVMYVHLFAVVDHCVPWYLSNESFLHVQTLVAAIGNRPFRT